MTPEATVFSEVREGRYQQGTTVVLGQKPHIPGPVDVILDTSIFPD